MGDISHVETDLHDIFLAELRNYLLSLCNIVCSLCANGNVRIIYNQKVGNYLKGLKDTPLPERGKRRGVKHVSS